jgi:[ribosomal protein S5]-alanine N-acetyltransferase
MAALEVATDPHTPDWRAALPLLANSDVTLRELQLSDAQSLYEITGSPEVARYTWPRPASVEAFQKFISWTQVERAAGRYIGFAIVPSGETTAAGLFELRQMQPRFFRAELGFLLDPAWWGKGVFVDAARLVLRFAFEVVGVHRIEARSSIDNHRSTAALRKIGARQEGILHGAFVLDGQYIDQQLWAIVAGMDFPAREQ